MVCWKEYESGRHDSYHSSNSLCDFDDHSLESHLGNIEKAKEFQKSMYFYFIDYAKVFV